MISSVTNGPGWAAIPTDSTASRPQETNRNPDEASDPGRSREDSVELSAAALTRTEQTQAEGSATEQGESSGPDDLTPEEQEVVEQLKARDQEVRRHEQAHATVGGQYASAPTYSYQAGPDGRRYAVGGEVQIDVSPEKTAEQTIQKMSVVRAAALAPAEPSGQDRKVAAEATRIEAQARAELAAEKNEGTEESEDAPARNQLVERYEPTGPARGGLIDAAA